MIEIEITDSNGFIKSGLSSNLMRLSAESKNLLVQRGSLYIGTGAYQTIKFGNEMARIYNTSVLNPLTVAPAVLTVVAPETLGWSRSLSNSNFYSQYSGVMYPISVQRASLSMTVSNATKATTVKYTPINQQTTIWERMCALGLDRQ